jgi:predicted DNA-binding antitoxin AbrB/MazE fold protein
MRQIEAVYRHGVFEPLEPVNYLVEEQRVPLSIDQTEKETIETWLQRVRELQAAIFERQGFLPDSTPGITEDRMR